MVVVLSGCSPGVLFSTLVWGLVRRRLYLADIFSAQPFIDIPLSMRFPFSLSHAVEQKIVTKRFTSDPFLVSYLRVC